MPPLHRRAPTLSLALLLALLAAAAAADATPRQTVTGAGLAPAASAPAAAAAATSIDEPARPGASDDLIRVARDAFVRKDRTRLATLRAVVVADRHPLAVWVDYWELTSRIADVRADEVEAFYARWPGSYLEDRLRNDWLLEAGRRRDWPAIARDLPRFRMNDDREVACYGLLAEALAGKDVRDAARAAWLAQKEADDGCQTLAQSLFDAKQFTDDDVRRKLRQTAETGRGKAARAVAQMLGKGTLMAVNDLWDSPARYLARKGEAFGANRALLDAIAIARLAASDTAAAATLLADRIQDQLSPAQAAWAWAVIGRQAAQALKPEALDAIDRAWVLATKNGPHGAAPERPDWSDELLAWQVRAALRSATGATRWNAVLRATEAMTPAERADPAWVYWRARAQLGLARPGADGDAARAEAQAALGTIASPLTFYGLLAAEELGLALPLPPRPLPAQGAEREAMRANRGLRRALALAALDLRDEARREWNFTLRGLSDRELLAAAQWACDAGDWQICINTSDRTRAEVDVSQRFVMPYAKDIAAAAQAAGLDPALVFGIIRQETRFMATMRSHAGASGLMQLMPPTARWVAKKSGIDYRAEQIADPATNLRLGTTYLKLVLDSFGGSAPMAAAAYNAGPGRPRRWRDGPVLEPAMWIENLPFAETRDYVKKVTANSAVYAALLGGRGPVLKARLGPPVGPRDAAQPEIADLP